MEHSSQRCSPAVNTAQAQEDESRLVPKRVTMLWLEDEEPKRSPCDEGPAVNCVGPELRMSRLAKNNPARINGVVE
jgi:hypothetical protein